MVDCEYCGNKIDELPRRCKYCGHYFCSHHRLPESHDCEGLKQYSKREQHKLQETMAKLASTHAIVNDRGYNDIVNIESHKTHYKHKKSKNETKDEPYLYRYIPPEEKESRKSPKVQEHHKKEYVETAKYTLKFIGKIKAYFKRKCYQIKSWLNSKSHRSYNNWNAFFMNILWIVVLSMSFLIIYSNLEKLNKIVLWFLPLGGTLLLVNAFFWSKFFWKLLKKIFYWYEGERNWVKYLILIILIFLLWQGYQNRETLFDSTIEFYNKINFSSILPLGISEEIPEDNLFSKKSVSTITEGISQNIKEVINPEPISDKTMDIEKAILKYTNVERKSQGLSALTWDAKLATVARDHSLDMVENDFFSHNNLKGEDPTDRAIRHGYNVHKELGGGWYSEGIAENIGKMPTGNVEGRGYISSDADSIGKAHVESWMNSPGHRANILNSQYNVLGVGCAYDGLYYICTQNFK